MQVLGSSCNLLVKASAAPSPNSSHSTSRWTHDHMCRKAARGHCPMLFCLLFVFMATLYLLPSDCKTSAAGKAKVKVPYLNDRRAAVSGNCNPCPRVSLTFPDKSGAHPR